MRQLAAAALVAAVGLGARESGLEPNQAGLDAIVYSERVRGGLGESHLWMVDPANPSAQARRLTAGLVIDASPVVSLDGRWLAFVRRTAEDSNGHLWIRRLPDGESRQISREGSDSDPFWSPDGRQLGFTRVVAPPLSDASTLFVVRPFDAASSERKLLARGPERQLSGHWHPGGTGVLFSTFGSGRNPYAIWSASLDGTRVGEIVPSDCCGVANGIYSPDGRRIAYISYTHSDAGDVYVAGFDGSRATRVTCDSGWQKPIWSPDGRELLLGGRLTHIPGLWRVPAPGPGAPCVRPSVRLSSRRISSYTWARVAR